MPSLRRPRTQRESMKAIKRTITVRSSLRLRDLRFTAFQLSVCLSVVSKAYRRSETTRPQAPPATTNYNGVAN